MSRPYITISIGRLIKGMSTEDISIKSLLFRQVAIQGLWNEIANFLMLNMDLFHKITEICEERIILYKEGLLSLKIEDLYSWHYEIVRGAITDLKLV